MIGHVLGAFGVIASLFKKRSGPEIAVSYPDTDSSLFVAGPPGWILPFGLGLVLVAAAAGDAFAGSPSCHRFLQDNGNTCVALLGTIMGPFLAYRGWRGHLKARSAEVLVNAQVN